MDIVAAKDMFQEALEARRNKICDELEVDLQSKHVGALNSALDYIESALLECKGSAHIVIGCNDNTLLNYTNYKDVIHMLRGLGYSANYNVALKHVIVNVSGWVIK